MASAEPAPQAVTLPALVDCGRYVDGVRLPDSDRPAEAMAQVRAAGDEAPGGFVWVGLHQPDLAQMQQIALVFGLHSLIVEDAVTAHQRPKLEVYDETLVLVLKTVNYVPHESTLRAREIVETGEIMVIVGGDFVITVRRGEHSGLAEVRRQLEANPRQLRLGPHAVLHAVADYVVDRYVEVTNLMETDIDTVEEMAFAPGTRTEIEPIYQLKREVVELRRAVSPLSAAFTRLQTDLRDLISKEVRRYLRDVAEHQAHVADQIASYDEMLSSLVQAALARVGMQQNTDMRKISAWAAMLAVPTLIAGIYGMNFTHMPVLRWAWGYPVTLAVMLCVCLALYRMFRRNGWL